MDICKPKVSLEELERRHAHHLALHQSPSLKKFNLEFAAGVGLGNPASSSENIILGNVPASYDGQKPKTFGAAATSKSPKVGQRLETTTQLAFRGYDDVATFRPETKHRVMKAADHEFVEQMFLLWNVHGKKGSGLL